MGPLYTWKILLSLESRCAEFFCKVSLSPFLTAKHTEFILTEVGKVKGGSSSN